MSAQDDQRAEPRRPSRTSKWVPGGLQLSISLTTFFVASVLLLFNFQFGLVGLWEISEQPAETVQGVLAQVKSMLTMQFVYVGVATIFLSMWAGLAFFKLCGPIYRISAFCVDVAKGRWDQRCTLREGDKLQETKDAINMVLDQMSGAIKSQHEILQDVRSVLESPSSRADIPALTARIDAAAREYSRRFGEPVSQPERASEPRTTTAIA